MNKHLCSEFNPLPQICPRGTFPFWHGSDKTLSVPFSLAPNGHLIPAESLELHISCFPSFLPIRDLHLHAFHNLAIFHRGSNLWHRTTRILRNSALTLHLLMSPLLKRPSLQLKIFLNTNQCCTHIVGLKFKPWSMSFEYLWTDAAAQIVARDFGANCQRTFSHQLQLFIRKD